MRRRHSPCLGLVVILDPRASLWWKWGYTRHSATYWMGVLKGFSYGPEVFDSAIGSTGEGGLVAQWCATTRRSLSMLVSCEYHHRLLPVAQAQGQVNGEGAYAPGDTSSISDAFWRGPIAGGLKPRTLASFCGSAIPAFVHFVLLPTMG